MVAGLEVSRYVILAIIVAIYFVMGMLMDALPMMMLTVPIFLPIMTQLGFDEIWFGIIIIVVMQLGLITPPVGSSCYVISGIARDIPLTKIFKGSLALLHSPAAHHCPLSYFPADCPVAPEFGLIRRAVK